MYPEFAKTVIKALANEFVSTFDIALALEQSEFW
jgi:hypothetical protein